MNPTQFLSQLINIPSATGEEVALGQFLIEYCQNLDLQTQVMQVTETRFNLLASYRDNPSILFSTHYDTVPPFTPATLRRNRLYGRGACDAKGSIAAMLSALISLPRDEREQCGLLLVVGEETDSIGAKTAAKSALQPQFIINGEPTGNKLVHGQKGTLIFTLRRRGLASHSGYPELGDSAINHLLDVISDLRNAAWGTNFDFGAASLNIGKITAGSAANTLADYAEAQCCLRLVASADDASARVRDITAERAEIEIHTASDPLRLHVPENEGSISVCYGSDANYLRQLAPVLMCGPGNIAQAHAEEEFLDLSELHAAIPRYRELACRLLNERSASQELRRCA